MKFGLLHKTLSYLMVLSAAATLLLSPETGAFAALLSVAAITLSWFAEPDRFAVGRLTTVWNIATVVFLLWLVVSVVIGQSVITAGVHFLLFVLVNKLFNRRTHKDYTQIYVVSFLMLIAGTAINTTLIYGICFLCYILFSTWTLVLFHLRREIEDSYLQRHGEGRQSEPIQLARVLNSRRVVGVGFLAGTSIISLGVMIGSIAFFTFFPRIGFGLFATQRRGGVAMSGFSEQVELGQHGRIRDNPEVVMRVTFPRGRPGHPLRWRGTALDTYQGGTWKQSRRLRGIRRRVPPIDGLFVLNYTQGYKQLTAQQLRDQLLMQQIYLEPLESTVIFAADWPVALEVPRARIGRRRPFQPRRGPFDEIRAHKLRGSGVRYLAYSQVVPPEPQLLRQAQRVTHPLLQRFLQLPQNLPLRVRQLANQITATAPTLHDKVLAVEHYLQENYRYTLELAGPAEAEPIDAFLFVTRQGHCEYFAAAMALLLRAVGIHTRQVNGFAGGQWNSYGNYLAVTQSEAHAWVEVFYNNVGWVAVDPTPPSGRPGLVGASVIGRLRQMVDALRMRWYSYVVEYDLNQQVSLFRRFGRLFSRRHQANSQPRLSLPRWPLLPVAALALLGLLWWWRRRHVASPPGRRRQQQALHWASQLYQRALRRLARQGFKRPAGRTPAEFAAELRQSAHPQASLIEQITACYYGARYGRAIGSKDRQQLSALVHQLHSPDK